jgi:hypothetical protein
MKPSTRRRLSPAYWVRKWLADRALRRFMREEEARLGTAIQALDFALDAREDDVGDPMDRIAFLETWREGGDLTDWPAYQPQAREPEVIEL